MDSSNDKIIAVEEAPVLEKKESPKHRKVDRQTQQIVGQVGANALTTITSLHNRQELKTIELEQKARQHAGRVNAEIDFWEAGLWYNGLAGMVSIFMFALVFYFATPYVSRIAFMLPKKLACGVFGGIVGCAAWSIYDWGRINIYFVNKWHDSGYCKEYLYGKKTITGKKADKDLDKIKETFRVPQGGEEGKKIHMKHVIDIINPEAAPAAMGRLMKQAGFEKQKDDIGVFYWIRFKKKKYRSIYNRYLSGTISDLKEAIRNA